MARSFAPCLSVMNHWNTTNSQNLFFSNWVFLLIRRSFWTRSSSEFPRQAIILQLLSILVLNGCMQWKYLGSSFFWSTKSDIVCSSIFHIPDFFNIPFNYHPSNTFCVLVGFDWSFFFFFNLSYIWGDLERSSVDFCFFSRWVNRDLIIFPTWNNNSKIDKICSYGFWDTGHKGQWTTRDGEKKKRQVVLKIAPVHFLPFFLRRKEKYKFNQQTLKWRSPGAQSCWIKERREL